MAQDVLKSNDDGGTASATAAAPAETPVRDTAMPSLLAMGQAASSRPATMAPPPLPPALPGAPQPSSSVTSFPMLPLPTSGDGIGETRRVPPPPPIAPTSPTASASPAPAKAPANGVAAPVTANDDLADADTDDDHDGDDPEPPRRVARRRPAGPVRGKLAANDDVPSIGGLIYALEQKPSTQVYRYAAIVSAIWGAAGTGFTAVSLFNDTTAATWGALLTRPTTFLMAAAVVVPIAVIWFLALLAYRSEELRLRSSTMTEVAVRLAEPDRMAEDSVASLGQAVRRQVSFMNEAVGRAIGRAGELEALVHNEVAALERSYEENERRIRGLISELAGERHALTSTSSNFNETLRTLGAEVPMLIDKLSNQQVNLAKIIQGAADNLSSLETTLARSVGSLENQLGGRTAQLQSVLENYTGALGSALGARTDHLQAVLEDHTSSLGTLLDNQSDRLGGALGGRTEAIQQMLEQYTMALAGALGSRTEQLQSAFTHHMQALDTAIANRTGNLQTVFEEYARALDTTLANRTERIDEQLVERTRALDFAFNERLRLFDDTIGRTTAAIDHAVGSRAHALSDALDSHARTFSETIARQSQDLDETLSHGISSVRRTSENITRQSLQAIEALAGQSDLLKNVSENLLGQINTVTNRFENQGHTILKAASALETANRKIDQTLQARQVDLSNTLERLEGKADDFGRYIENYSSTIEGSLSAAEQRARAAAEELKLGAQSHRQLAFTEIERLRTETDAESERALADLKHRLSSVSNEVSTQLGSLTDRFSETSEEMRNRAQRLADDMSREQARMKEEFDRLPQASKSSAEAMRRALQDQLKALDQLSTLTTREAQRRDVSLPMANGGPLPSMPSPSVAATAAPAPGTADAPRAAPAPQRSLSNLSASLAQELGARNLQAAPAAPAHAAPPQGAASDAWSLGDLLKRASRDDEGGRASPAPQPAAPGPQPMPPAAAPAAQPFTLNIDVLSRALDPATSAVIWSRLKSGQRGIMVRSIYSADGRSAFDEVSRRYPVDPSLQATVNRYLNDFERILREAEAKDGTGRIAQAHMTSATGRVYLFLAHASGRLA